MDVPGVFPGATVRGRRRGAALRTAIARRSRMVGRGRRRVSEGRAARELSCRIDHHCRLVALNIVTAIGYTDMARAREVLH